MCTYLFLFFINKAMIIWFYRQSAVTALLRLLGRKIAAH